MHFLKTGKPEVNLQILQIKIKAHGNIYSV
jgi:hypothetical protein